MKPKNWMAEAFGKNKGALHRDLGVSEKKTIPFDKLLAASHQKGKTGQRARAAVNARRANQ